MGETFRSLVTDGPLLVAAGVAALVGLISFASPCVLPLVPGYLAYVSGLVGTGAPATAPAPGRRAGRRPPCAPRSSPRGPHGRSARCCSCSASPLVFVAFGAAFGGLGRLLLAVRRRPQPGVRRRHDRGRAGLPRLAAAAAAHQAALRPPGRRAGRRAAAGHRLRAGLDAVPGPDPRRRSTRWPSPRPPPRRGALLGVAYCLGLGRAVRARRARRPLGHGRDRASCAGTPARSPGSAAPSSSSSAAAGHRRVDRAHAVAALLAGGHRLRGVGTVTRRRAPPRPTRRRRTRRRRPSAGPARSPRRLLHWWRRLTAMRTAIVLLFLLALAAVPGSLLPQRSLSQNKVNAVLHRPPDAGAGARPALPVRRLQLAVVRRDLPAAVHLADRLRAARGRSSTPGRCGPRRRRRRGNLLRLPDSGELGTPLAGARGARRRRGGAAGPPVPRGPPRRPAGPSSRPRRATSRRPATCCSTCRWWRCCSAWPAASSGATRAASWSPRARASATPSSSTTPTRPGRWSTSGDLTPLCVDLEDFRAKYEQNLTAASFTADITLRRARRRPAGRRRSASTSRCGSTATAST